MSPRVLLGALVLAAATLVIASGCATTIPAEIGGLQVTAGVEVSTDGSWSPVVGAGYAYLKWTDTTAIGGSVAFVASPMTGRYVAVAEGYFGLGPPVGMPLVPLAGGVELGVVKGSGHLGFRLGLSSLAYVPPPSCDDEVGCLPGAWIDGDIAHPDWLPMVGYRLVLYPTFDRVDDGSDWKKVEIETSYLEVVHQLSFSPVIAGYLMGGSQKDGLAPRD